MGINHRWVQLQRLLPALLSQGLPCQPGGTDTQQGPDRRIIRLRLQTALRSLQGGGQVLFRQQRGGTQCQR
jgi:hypothetical protein